ncbi:MAG: toll/interleukin-1 receptor domain-containing protein [Planctomycetes bacterium]|nr:toll/interleukin-1 receptor domain-containing protein [Planctomycetota bacterium]
MARPIKVRHREHCTRRPRFQTDYGHKSRDGLVGPGTRRLLTKAVIARGEGFFERGRISPEYAIFLSYSRKDERSLSGIVQGVRSCGIPVFRDKEAIPAGASWPDVLYRSVRKCQVFLCVLSPQSAGSINVLIEVALARHAHRPIVPVLLEAVELPSSMRALMEGIQHLDLSGRVDSSEALGDLLEALSVYGLFPQPQQ